MTFVLPYIQLYRNKTMTHLFLLMMLLLVEVRFEQVLIHGEDRMEGFHGVGIVYFYEAFSHIGHGREKDERKPVGNIWKWDKAKRHAKQRMDSEPI